MPRPSINDLVTATRALAHLPEDARTPAPRLGQWSEEDWRGVLLDLPVDERAFEDRFRLSRPDQIALLWRWWSDAERDGPARGYLGFYLLTLIAMHQSDRMRFGGGADPLAERAIDAKEVSDALVADPEVREAIRVLYDPCWKDRRKLNRRSKDFKAIPLNVLERWENIDFGELSFHRSGTTSIIFRGVTVGEESDGSKRSFALKCLIYPYQEIEAITKATRWYREEYRLDPRQIEAIKHLVPVWASYDTWILMNFVEGDTLAEALAKTAAARAVPRRDIARTLDLPQLDRYGTAILEALAELEKHNRHHGDLSPSNIIVEETGEEGHPVRMRLIDLGVNYLHTRSVTGLDHGDADYVAPETRESGVNDGRADLYSLGRLLIAIGGVPPNPDGTVPDAFYLGSVGLARLLEDLVDADPAHRLAVVGLRGEAKPIPHLTGLFNREIAVAKGAAAAVQQGFLARLRGIAPGQGFVKRQKESLRILKQHAGAEQPGLLAWLKGVAPGRGFTQRLKGSLRDLGKRLRDRAAVPFHIKQAQRLRRWALLCSWCVWIAFGLVIMWWGRDIGFSWQLKYIELALNLAGVEGPEIPVLDAFRAADYPIDDPRGSLPARIIACSFILAGARWYLNVLADLTPRTDQPRTGRTLARTRFNDAAMRSAAVLPAVYVTIPTLVDRDWWPLFTAIGVTTVAIVNTSCLLFARDAFTRARTAGLSTVPKGDSTSMEKFASWVPTSWMYSIPVWIVGTLLLLDLVEDELVYAVFVTIINIAMWYVIKCGTEAPYVRVALTRSYLAAERLDRLAPEPAPEVPAQRREPQSAAAAQAH